MSVSPSVSPNNRLRSPVFRDVSRSNRLEGSFNFVDGIQQARYKAGEMFIREEMSRGSWKEDIEMLIHSYGKSFY